MSDRLRSDAAVDGRARRLATDERGVSTTLGYALSLTVATLLVGGLLIAGGGFVEDQRERTVRNELEVIGQQVSADVAAVDRLAQTVETGTVTVDRNLPERVTGKQYTIAVRADGADRYLVLSVDRPEVSVRVELTSETTVAETAVSGGDVRVVYDPSADELEVQHG
ncbi:MULTISPECIES: DUF7266 family protein [Halorussus]|uniref:DUF7266 family protein n=1 Tax=Halorussus TaxID=1070314 RepID=UPI00209FDB80|nr:hypothetical protein [Halorussus vallis]USZ75545.1 hypothetical protein NGM07_19200 [Halorussus vallis]